MKDNVLVTPDLQSGCLPGITREAVLELAEAAGTSVSQSELELKELVEADEAFITNSLLEIMPLREIDGSRLRGPAEGRITSGLAAAYRELVSRETGQTP